MKHFLLLATAALGCVLLGTASPSPGPSASPAPIVVHMKNFAFDPATITVRPGDTVEWINDDGAAHSATARDKSWDSGELGKGGSWSKTFLKAGTYAYYCDDHAFMKAQIIVKP